MSDVIETKAERCDRMLGELAELGLTVARDLAARALAAETPDEAAHVALAFHRISRSLRQTLALEAKVERDRLAATRAAAIDAAAEAERQAQLDAEAARKRIARRKGQVHAALDRLLWEEAERDEDAFAGLVEELDTVLNEAVFSDDFDDIPLEILIAQLKADMGLERELGPTACASPETAPRPPPDYPLGSDAWATGHPPDSG